MALFKVRPFPVPIAQCCIGDVAAEMASGAAVTTYVAHRPVLVANWLAPCKSHRKPRYSGLKSVFNRRSLLNKFILNFPLEE